jgi:hypothetical protein
MIFKKFGWSALPQGFLDVLNTELDMNLELGRIDAALRGASRRG